MLALLADLNAGEQDKFMDRRLTQMKWGKKLKATNTMGANARRKIARFNQTRTVRPSDQIHIDKPRKAAKRPRGRFEKWTENGMLSAAWISSDKHHRTTEASRVAGRANDGSHTYVSSVSGSIAHRYIQLQAAALQELPACRLGVLELAFDETEHTLKVGGTDDDDGVVVGGQQLFMFHSILTWILPNLDEQRHNITMPPLVLEDQTTESILAAIQLRFPVILADLVAKAKDFTIVVNSDSASACLRLSKIITQRPSLVVGNRVVHVLHPGCLMHQAALVCGEPLRWLKIVNNMFRAATWMKNGGIKKTVKREIAKETIKTVYDAPADCTEEEFATDMLKLLHWDLDVEDELTDILKHLTPDGLLKAIDPLAENKDTADKGDGKSLRRQRARTLRKMWGGNWWSDRKVAKRHPCLPGCCRTLAEAEGKAKRALWEGWYDTAISIPALNRWTKLYQPMAWMLFGLSIHNVLGNAMKRLLDKRGHEVNDVNVDALERAAAAGPPDVADPAAPPSMDEYRKRERTRFCKTAKWLVQQHCRPNLASAVIVLRPMQQVLRKLFESVRVQHESFASTIVPFTTLETNPGV